MKKVYVAPTAKNIKISPLQMLCTSPIPGGGNGDGAEAESAMHVADMAWDDED